MLSDTKQKNNFKFGLFYKDRVISEKIFSADIYNHLCRYSVNIKDWTNLIKHEFQEVLSRRDNNLTTTLNGYDLLIPITDSFFGSFHGKDVYTQEKDGIEDGFKFKLQINDNIIIERVFSVKNFNYKSIYSTELIDLIFDWVERIEDKIKTLDEQQMWEEEDILANTKLSRSEIRALSKDERQKQLKKINYN